MLRIAALFVATNGPYFNLPNVDPWDETRDARRYEGPYPVISHPPCERWGRYWFGGPSVKVRRKMGDDGDCFKSALESVRRYGGIIEHPAASHAWKHFGLGRPLAEGWARAADGIGWHCQVSQGHYGHPAEKKTWLYVVTPEPTRLPDLKWGPCPGLMRLDEGFHSKEERKAARAAGKKPIKRLSQKQKIHTPEAFRTLLISIVQDIASLVSKAPPPYN